MLISEKRIEGIKNNFLGCISNARDCGCDEKTISWIVSTLFEIYNRNPEAFLCFYNSCQNANKLGSNNKEIRLALAEFLVKTEELVLLKEKITATDAVTIAL